MLHCWLASRVCGFIFNCSFKLTGTFQWGRALPALPSGGGWKRGRARASSRPGGSRAGAPGPGAPHWAWGWPGTSGFGLFLPELSLFSCMRPRPLCPVCPASSRCTSLPGCCSARSSLSRSLGARVSLVPREGDLLSPGPLLEKVQAAHVSHPARDAGLRVAFRKAPLPLVGNCGRQGVCAVPLHGLGDHERPCACVYFRPVCAVSEKPRFLRI